MALNLLKSGSKLVVWNRSSAKCDEFVEKGATMAASAADVIRQSDVTYSMLSTPEVAKVRRRMLHAGRSTCVALRGPLHGGRFTGGSQIFFILTCLQTQY